MILAALLLTPQLAFAVGESDSAPPKPTETSTECAKGDVWDEKTATCIKAESSLLNGDQRYGAVRELAYAGREAEALAILATMTEGETARVLTYQGFLLRQTGQVNEGIIAYERAIALDAGNILARSYYGQLLVQLDQKAEAQLQLAAIRMYGGGGTWAETALSDAIATGVTSNY